MQVETKPSSSRAPAPAPASLADEDELTEVDSSFSYSLESLNSRTGAPRDAGEFVFDIDESLLIDRRRVRIGKVLGEGPNSIVYEGLYNSRPVAVKIIQPTRASEVSADRKEKFQREVLLLSNMKHEAVVKFVGATVEPSMMVITELMRGGTLQKYLWSVRPIPLDLKLSLTYALDISRAMEYLHARGIIHRDLKPSNILLNKDKTRIKLADFGLARELSTDMTSEAGTYRWMAPEIFSIEPTVGKKKKYDHKIDVYSFSIVLWELMTNETPFKGRNSIMVAYATAKKMRPGLEGIPKEIVPLLQSCWSEDPKSRPEFNDITEYLHTLYHNLYPPEVKVKPPTSKVFDIENPNESFNIFLNNAITDDNSDTNDNNEEDTPAEYDNQAQGQDQVPNNKPKSLFLRCFTCSKSHVSD